MNLLADKSIAVATLTVLYIGLTGAFLLNLWGHPASLTPISPTPPEFTNTATVRLSAADLVRTEGDTSGLACYTCHDAKKQLVVKFDVKGSVILYEPHKDIIMQHGRNNRNDHCFICHDPKNHEQLRAHEGQTFKMTESSRL